MNTHIRKHIMRDTRDNNNFFGLSFPINDVLEKIKNIL